MMPFQFSECTVRVFTRDGEKEKIVQDAFRTRCAELSRMFGVKSVASTPVSTGRSKSFDRELTLTPKESERLPFNYSPTKKRCRMEID